MSEFPSLQRRGGRAEGTVGVVRSGVHPQVVSETTRSLGSDSRVQQAVLTNYVNPDHPDRVFDAASPPLQGGELAYLHILHTFRAHTVNEVASDCRRGL